ncbi:hypothetical protein JVT61DRAFT_14694 [Boletus reticuloceps]|uniref:Uncharacterized protein n=1 Tax=Boletus reticuloceps TaxID=495285 RepID=A0A8I2YSV8_9AGAM|nr:hypothetical protein JVT61DRAFT_14694 [Boletus reticuloceps]
MMLYSQDLSQMKSLYLVHPWLDSLLEQDDAHSGALVEDDVPPPSAYTDDGEISDEEFDDDTSPLPGPELPSYAAPEHTATTVQSALAHAGNIESTWDGLQAGCGVIA